MLLVRGLSYVKDWEQVTLCGVSEERINDELLGAMNMAVGIVHPIRMVTTFIRHHLDSKGNSRTANIMCVIEEKSKKVLAQAEIDIQDGCCPPVVTVLAHQNYECNPKTPESDVPPT